MHRQPRWGPASARTFIGTLPLGAECVARIGHLAALASKGASVRLTGMRGILWLLIAVLLGSCARAQPFSSFGSETPESAFLNSFRVRHMRMGRGLERARLKRALGDEWIDLTRVKRDMDEFFGD